MKPTTNLQAHLVSLAVWSPYTPLCSTTLPLPARACWESGGTPPGAVANFIHLQGRLVSFLSQAVWSHYTPLCSTPLSLPACACWESGGTPPGAVANFWSQGPPAAVPGRFPLSRGLVGLHAFDLHRFQLLFFVLLPLLCTVCVCYFPMPLGTFGFYALEAPATVLHCHAYGLLWASNFA